MFVLSDAQTSGLTQFTITRNLLQYRQITVPFHMKQIYVYAPFQTYQQKKYDTFMTQSLEKLAREISIVHFSKIFVATFFHFSTHLPTAARKKVFANVFANSGVEVMVGALTVRDPGVGQCLATCVPPLGILLHQMGDEISSQKKRKVQPNMSLG